MTIFLPFDHPQASDVAFSGGKGASLSRAARALPVPPGLIISSAAYREYLRPLQGEIRRLLAEAGEDLDAASAAVQALLGNTPLPAAWRAPLQAALHSESLDDARLAVRSSGTMEDLPGAAFAGQHDTLLGIRGEDATLAAIRSCYVSLWNPHVMRYRQRLGLDHQQAAMAVVLQQMVDVDADEAAGVAFSIDPVRGALDQILINAAFGLGETVVGGEAPVDEYRLRRTDFGAVDTLVQDKPQAIIVSAAGGTETVDLSAEHASRPALSEAQRAQVGQLALDAELHFGFPQDIEWGFHAGRLYLLQSRPVTRVAARWTRDESAERFPNPVTPLTWDLCEAGFHASLNHSFALMGLPSFGDKWFAMRDGYIYGNQTAVELYSGRTPAAMLRDVDSIRAALPQVAQQFGWVQELPVRWMRDLDTYLIGIGALSHEPLDDKDLPALWDHVLRINALGADYFLPNIAISLTQRLLYAALLQMLRLALPVDQAQACFDRLLAMADTKTGQVNQELWALSRMIRGDAALQRLLVECDSLTCLARVDEFPGFAAEFRAFLRRHGHRELDFDAYQPTWSEAPQVVVDQLRLMAERDDESRADVEREQRKTQVATELLVLNHAPEELRYLVQEVIRLARAYTALDDLEHYQTTRLTPVLRRGLRAIGERLVAAGVLDEAMDVFFVPLQPLDAALREATPQALAPLREMAAAQKVAYEHAASRAPAWVHGEDQALPEQGDSLKGIAGSPGRVEGEVFVVHGPEDFSRFPAGAILVARTTNPAWTALFYQACGVITESGGALSHGAVTARELGLPAVMAVRGATSLLSNGQRVRIDGSAGIVALS